MEEDLSERRRSETVVDNEVLREIVEKNSSNTVREYAEELDVSHTIISRHLKLIDKVKKMDKRVPHELNENHKQRGLEILCAPLHHNQNDSFLNNNCMNLLSS